MDIYVSPEAKSNIRRMTDEANAAASAYGACPEVVEMLRSTLNVINQTIQLGGRITAGDETMPLNGSNEFIAFGVARHKHEIPEIYRESIRAMFAGSLADGDESAVEDTVTRHINLGIAPFINTYGVHS